MYIKQESADQFRSIFSSDPETAIYGAPGTVDLPVRRYHRRLAGIPNFLA